MIQVLSGNFLSFCSFVAVIWKPVVLNDTLRTTFLFRLRSRIAVICAKKAAFKVYKTYLKCLTFTILA